MSREFSVEVPGKWVLAGEHAVLRGATALVLPHPAVSLKLDFTPASDGGLDIQPGSASAVVREIIGAAKGFVAPEGLLKVESTIPVGAGLGSSAALCFALSQWMNQDAEFATRLEDLFHGQSSGMDVAAVAARQPITFVRGKGSEVLPLTRIPHFTFHDTGLRARTLDCVAKVEALAKRDPARASKIDEAMNKASLLAKEGLEDFDAGESAPGLALIAQAMRQAQDCFYAWDLVPSQVRQVERTVMAEGALAVKLTGAGGGGFVVALWSGA